MEDTRSVLQFVKAPTLPPSPGYSQAAEVRGGRTVYVAGQVALDRSGTLVGRGDFGAQAKQAFENLGAALAASRAGFGDIVKLNSYFVDIREIPAFREVRDQFIDTKNLPVSTAVEVKRLFKEDFLIEIEAIAVVSK